MAILSEDVDTIDLLLENGYNPSNHSNAAIKLAAYLGNFQLIKRLIEDNRINITTNNFHVLKLAAIEDHEQIIDYLLAINPSTCNYHMLSWAAYHGKTKIFKHYLNQTEFDSYTTGGSVITNVLNGYVTTKGFSSNITFDWYGKDPGDFMIFNNDITKYEKHSNIEMLDLLVKDRRFNFDQYLGYNMYPLKLAIIMGNLEAVKLILSTFDKIP
jgi:hypothetical protein